METATETKELSLKEKMAKAYSLSYKFVCYGQRPAQDITDEEAELPHSTVWGWVDGLVGKYYLNMSTGHCSVKAFTDFDPAEFERQVDEDIVALKAKLSILKGH